MNILGIPILTLVVFFPVAGMVVVLFLPGSRPKAIKIAANIVTGLEFAATLLLLSRFDAASGDMQLVERLPWIKAIGAQYLLGVDGISLLLVLLTSLLTFVATLSSSPAARGRLKEYYVFLLLLETGLVGVFLALDLLLFYVFWEIVLVPMYFLIGIWGGERRLYAAIKFFLYTLFGSVALLLGILVLRAARQTFHWTPLLGA